MVVDTMQRPAIVLVLALLLLSCGSGAQDRPVILGTFPAQGQVLADLVGQIRITYDDPVTILMPQAAVLTAEGIAVPLYTCIDPDDPRSILVTPTQGFSFLPGRVDLRLAPGFTINDKEHYRLETFDLYFTHGDAPTAFFAVASGVVQADAQAFAPIQTTVTPGSRTPVAVVGSAIGNDVRMWVQLADGGGTGRALAVFPPGDAAMTEIELSRDVGGDLTAEAPALALGADGRTLYAAWRDTIAQRVRLHRIDVETGLETHSVLLSPAASPTTRPMGLVVALDASSVDVTCAAADGARLVRVTADTLAEVDLGPDAGVDGLPLPQGAGPVGRLSTWRLVAPPTAITAHLTITDPPTDIVTEDATDLTGSPAPLLVTPDGRWVVEGLSGFASAEEGLVAWTGHDLLADRPIPFSDEAPGVAPGTATAVVALATYPGFQRLLVVLDNDVAITLRWGDTAWEQDDLDDAMEGIQGVDLSGTAPGATFVAFIPSALAP